MAESAAAANTKSMSNDQPDENDDDYMGDLSRFLPPSESSLPPPKPSSSSNKKHHHPPSSSSSSSVKKNQLKSLSWQQRRKLERERKQKQEDQQTLAKVQVPIPQSNIGFKLLKQMGYTPDSSSSSLGQPIGLEIRRSRAGIGLDDDAIAPHKEDEKRKRRREKQEEEEALIMEEEFGSRLKSRWQSKRILANFNKAKAVLDQLENRDIVEPLKREEGEDDNDEDEEEEEITQEDLHCVLMRLRDEFNYCLFCGCKYESRDALSANCPGTDEDDH